MEMKKPLLAGLTEAFDHDDPLSMAFPAGDVELSTMQRSARNSIEHVAPAGPNTARRFHIRSPTDKFLVMARINNHLANDRTWLAWLRTTGSMFGISFGLIKFDDITGGASGIVFMLIGVAIFVIGTQRYMTIKRALLANENSEENLRTSDDHLGRCGVSALSLVVLAAVLFTMVWYGMHFFGSINLV